MRIWMSTRSKGGKAARAVCVLCVVCCFSKVSGRAVIYQAGTVGADSTGPPSRRRRDGEGGARSQTVLLFCFFKVAPFSIYHG
jgi:hypothetical protein